MISDYYDFIIFLGGILILGGLVYFIFRQFLQNIFISEEEISQLRTANQISTQIPTIQISLPKISITMILLALIIGSFVFNQLLMWKMGSFGILVKL